MFPFNNKKIINNPPILCWDIFAMEIENNVDPKRLPVGGFIKQTLVDYPGYISAMVFTQGCNFRCFYCHNPELVNKSRSKADKWDDLYKWVNANKGMLDAVVFSGGEPTIHPQLPKAIKLIKELGLKVKLDTNGTNPDMLKRLIKQRWVDYVAMDIKHVMQLEFYKTVVGNDCDETMMKKMLNSKSVLEKGGVDYEFRVTALKPIHDKNSLNKICAGSQGEIYLQQFKREKTLDNNKSTNCFSFSEEELASVVEQLKEKKVFIR